MGLIYKVENIINHKIYVGQTIRPFEDRKRQHLADSLKYDYPLYLALRKYGSESFMWSILEEAEDNLLNDREAYWIAYFDSMKAGYNCDEGGAKGAWSEEVKIKISKALQGKHQKLTEEGLRRKIEAASNRTWTQDSCDKLSKSHIGKKHSDEHRRAISEKLRGVPKKNKENYSKIWTEEARARRSKEYSGENNPNFGKKHSPEVKMKISTAAKLRKPRIQTEEEKQKRAESIKAYWRKKRRETENLDTN